MIPINCQVALKSELGSVNPMLVNIGTVVDYTPQGLLKIQWEDGTFSILNTEAQKRLEWL